MKEITDKIQYVPVSLLKKNNKNPRIVKNAKFAKLCESIKKDPLFLELRPILCDKNYEIYAGNQRFSACVVLGYKEVPCIVSDVDQKTKERRIIEDNLHAGEFDYVSLKDDFDEELLKDLFDDEKLFEEEKKEEVVADSKYVESMELKNFESYDYIVFAFNDSRDYLNVCQKLGIGRVDASFSPKIKKIGMGRVVDGKTLAGLVRN